MKKIILLISIISTLSLSAAPIGEKRAKEIANNFFAAHSTRSTAPVLSLEWAGNDFDAPTSTRATVDAENALLYIYNRADAEGFVVVAGDDRVEKSIIAFSHEGSFDVNDMPDGTKALLQAWCEQIADTRSGNRLSATRATDNVGNVVCEYETAKWRQNSPYNKYTPARPDGGTGNGGNSPVGCQAVALAIICHYHQWPDMGVGTIPEYESTKDGTRTIPANELGQTYDYSKMLVRYTSGNYTDEQIDDAARLMYDLGTAVKMQYGNSGSSAASGDIKKAMATYFKYSYNMRRVEASWYGDSEWVELLKENINRCGPTFLRGESETGGGHAFVLDGYTDADYFHLNYGVEESKNIWQLLPNIYYCKNQAAMFDMVPDKDGSTANAGGMMSLYGFQWGDDYRYGIETNASSYKAGENFKTTLSYLSDGVVNFTGTIMVAHCNKNDEIKDILWTFDAVLNAGSLSSISFDAALSNSVESGDCLRMFYKNEGQEEWSLSRRSNGNTSDKVLLSATPQEVAESLSLTYTKSSKTISIFSAHATQYTITNASGMVVTSGEVASRNWADIDVSTFESGTYTCSFACGGEPYKLIVNL